MSNLLAIVLALIAVESGGNDLATNGHCVGCLQLTPVYVQEVNRIHPEPVSCRYTLADRTNRLASIQMVVLTFTHYSRSDWTVRDYALFHKCGPRGMRGPLTPADLDYAARVENLVTAGKVSAANQKESVQ